MIVKEDPRAIEIRSTQSGHAKPDICGYPGAVQQSRPCRPLRPIATKRCRGDCGLLTLRVTIWNDTTNADSIVFASSRTFPGQRSGAWNSVVCSRSLKSEITLLTLYGSEAMTVPTG
jgi:hypothetical protein